MHYSIKIKTSNQDRKFPKITLIFPIHLTEINQSVNQSLLEQNILPVQGEESMYGDQSTMGNTEKIN